MTRYFYDSEFLDDGKTIELISIGIVRDTGEEYYAVVADADWDRIERDPWLMKNVVAQLPRKSEWKPKAQIAVEVRDFLLAAGKPELWAWYSAYDHVALAQLWGRMLDMPRGIPHFTNDLRSYIDWARVHVLPEQGVGVHDALADARHLMLRYDYVQEQRTARPSRRGLTREEIIALAPCPECRAEQGTQCWADEQEKRRWGYDPKEQIERSKVHVSRMQAAQTQVG